MLIYHILPRTEWEAARAAGEYRALSLGAEGFIHASTGEQVVDTANRYYHGQQGLVLLAIDSAKCKPELRFETAQLPAGPQDFPHLYGPLNLDAVVEVIDFPPGPDGSFDCPPALTARF